MNPGALCLTSAPRVQAVSEKWRETGAAEMEEVGKEEAARVAVAIQRRMSRGGIYMLMLIAFANCIYCADLPASPVHHSESLSCSQSFSKPWVPYPSHFILSSSPQA